MESIPTIAEMFPLPDEARKLQIFIGDWKVEGTMNVENNSLKVKGSWKFDPAAAGWGVQARMKMEVEGMGSYEEVDIVGFDTNEHQFHLFSVTNTAATHDHKGKWADENTLNFTYEGLQEGKKYKEDITVKLRGSTEFSIHEVDTLDGRVTLTMDVTLRK